ncbi:MAG: ABC transporter permease, partial [Gemmatimonadota bacterium]
MLLTGSALLAPAIAPYDPDAQTDIVATRYQAPSVSHPMGTDRFGRDIFSRTLYGARISLSIGFLAILIAITLGTAIGAIAGFFGGRLDTVLMRGVDLLLSFPRLVLLVVLVALFEPSIALVTLVLGLTGWMGVSRIVRGQVLTVREMEFVTAARVLGFGRTRILARH